MKKIVTPAGTYEIQFLPDREETYKQATTKSLPGGPLIDTGLMKETGWDLMALVVQANPDITAEEITKMGVGGMLTLLKEKGFI